MLLTLLDRVIEEADATAGDVLDRLAEDPRARWRELIARFHATFGGHRAVVLACAEVRGTNAEVRRLWAAVLDRWVHAVQSAIEGERRRGAAPDGLPARDLAIALNSMNERVWYATFAGDGPAVAEQDVVEVLLDVWLTAIYRTTAPPPRLRPAQPVRVKSMIQLVSQVCSPSVENACSQRAVVALMPDQMNRHRTGRPSSVSSA